MAKKMNLDAVHPAMADSALSMVSDLGSLYSRYITIHFRQTGRLAPGFDAKVLIEWVKVNRPEVYGRLSEKKTGGKK